MTGNPSKIRARRVTVIVSSQWDVRVCVVVDSTAGDNGERKVATLPSKQAALPVLPYPPHMERRRGSPIQGSRSMRRHRPRNGPIVEMQHLQRLQLPTGQPYLRQVTCMLQAIYFINDKYTSASLTHEPLDKPCAQALLQMNSDVVTARTGPDARKKWHSWLETL